MIPPTESYFSTDLTTVHSEMEEEREGAGERLFRLLLWSPDSHPEFRRGKTDSSPPPNEYLTMCVDGYRLAVPPLRRGSHVCAT